MAAALLSGYLGYLSYRNLQAAQTAQTQTSQLTTQVTQLEADLKAVRAERDGLKTQLATYSQLVTQVSASLTTRDQREAALVGQLQAAKAHISNTDRQQRELALRASRKASLLLRLYNRQADCLTTHLGQLGGHCTAGEWYADKP